MNIWNALEKTEATQSVHSFVIVPDDHATQCQHHYQIIDHTLQLWVLHGQVAVTITEEVFQEWA